MSGLRLLECLCLQNRKRLSLAERVGAVASLSRLNWRNLATRLADANVGEVVRLSLK